jgi:hypothetical protein
MKRLSSAAIASAVGIVDSVPILSYAVFATVPVTGQLFPLAAKLILLALYKKQVRGLARLEFLFLSILCFLLMLSFVSEIFSSHVSVQSYLNYTAFILSLALSLALLNPDDVTRYLRALVLVSTSAAFLHFGLALLGQVEAKWGRYLYIRYGHPNVGGAVAATAAIAAGLSFGKRGFALVAVVMAALAIMMQSRAALIVIVLVATIHTLAVHRLRGRIAVLLVFLASALLLALLSEDMSETISGYLIRDVLLLESETRGIDSGLTGRVDRWSDGAELFFEHLWLGVGASYFYTTAEYSPHNAFLKSLALHGLMAVLFWLTVFASLARIWRCHLYGALIIGSGVILMIFNDPFIDLNFYPFCFYVILLKYSSFVGRGSFKSGPLANEFRGMRIRWG